MKRRFFLLVVKMFSVCFCVLIDLATYSHRARDVVHPFFWSTLLFGGHYHCDAVDKKSFNGFFYEPTHGKKQHRKKKYRRSF